MTYGTVTYGSGLYGEGGGVGQFPTLDIELSFGGENADLESGTIDMELTK